MEELKEFTYIDDYQLGGTPNDSNDESYFNLNNCSTPRAFDDSYFINEDPFALQDVQTPSASLPVGLGNQQDGTIEPNVMWNTSSMQADQMQYDGVSAPYYDTNLLSRGDFQNIAPSQICMPTSQPQQRQQPPEPSTKSTVTRQQSSSIPSSSGSDARSSRGSKRSTADDNKPTEGDAPPPKKRQRRARKKGPEPTKEELDQKKQAFLERNRQAASRCRQKKKVEHGSLEETVRQKKFERDCQQNLVNELQDEIQKLRELAFGHVECFPEIRPWLDDFHNRSMAAYTSRTVSPRTVIDPALESGNSMSPPAMSRGNSSQASASIQMSRGNSEQSKPIVGAALPTAVRNSFSGPSIFQTQVHKRNHSLPTSLLHNMSMGETDMQRSMNATSYAVSGACQGVPDRSLEYLPSFAAANVELISNIMGVIPHRDSGIYMDENKDNDLNAKVFDTLNPHSPQIQAAMAAAPRVAMAD